MPTLLFKDNVMSLLSSYPEIDIIHSYIFCPDAHLAGWHTSWQAGRPTRRQTVINSLTAWHKLMKKWGLCWNQLLRLWRTANYKNSTIYHEFHETYHSVTLIVLVNSHQRWKQTRNRVCFHLWCELTSTINVTKWQVSWNSPEQRAQRRPQLEGTVGCTPPLLQPLATLQPKNTWGPINLALADQTL